VTIPNITVGLCIKVRGCPGRTGGPPLVDCPLLLVVLKVQYGPCPDVVSSISRASTRLKVQGESQLDFYLKKF
jgi:hypothetical protein